MNTQARSTTRKVVGSLGVIGAAAAIAGLGTFGSFTDSTAAETTVTSGTVDINLAEPSTPLPVTISGFVPGDTMSRAITLTNDGDSDLAWVNLGVDAVVSSALDTDTTDGLQLEVESCSVAWTEGGTTDAPTYTCSGTERLMGAGAAVDNFVLATPKTLRADGVDHLLVTLSLPTSADNTFQGLSSTLSLQFTGMQRAGTAR